MRQLVELSTDEVPDWHDCTATLVPLCDLVSDSVSVMLAAGSIIGAVHTRHNRVGQEELWRVGAFSQRYD